MSENAGASETRPGSERIYPGSHGLRLISLIQVESRLVPEGIVVLGTLQKTEGPQFLQSVYTPAQISELLSAVAASISDQERQSNELLAKLGHHDLR